MRAILQAEPSSRRSQRERSGTVRRTRPAAADRATFFADLPARRGRTCCAGGPGGRDTNATGGRAGSRLPPPTHEAVGELRELLTRLDPTAASRRCAGWDLAQRRRRLLRIVALSAQLAGDHSRHAFTASFPGFARDEWSLAHEVATAAGVVEHYRVCPVAAELLEDLDRLVLDQEEPFMTTSIYAQWRVMAAAREAGVTVLLDGQGADELFGGYDVSGGWALRSIGHGAPCWGASSPDPLGSIAPRPLGLRHAATSARAALPSLAGQPVCLSGGGRAGRGHRAAERSGTLAAAARAAARGLPYQSSGPLALRRPRFDGSLASRYACRFSIVVSPSLRCRCRRTSSTAAA